VNYQKIKHNLLKVYIGFSVIILFCLFTILFTPATRMMHQILATGDQPRKSEAIVVLCSVFPYATDDGLPCLSTLVRLEKGLQLYRKGYADKIIVFGGIIIPKAQKTIAQAMKERLLLYGVPESDILVHDDIPGAWGYYDNLMLLFEKYKDRFDFLKVMFVTSAENSFRIRKSLEKIINHPIIVLSEQYEYEADWGQRFQLFRRAANEILVGIPLFYFTGRI
jgi:uncharacterized SAM-binding protein YcdF (DUF218 family)